MPSEAYRGFPREKVALGPHRGPVCLRGHLYASEGSTGRNDDVAVPDELVTWLDFFSRVNELAKHLHEAS